MSENDGGDINLSQDASRLSNKMPIEPGEIKYDIYDADLGDPNDGTLEKREGSFDAEMNESNKYSLRRTVESKISLKYSQTIDNIKDMVKDTDDLLNQINKR